ncbi:hypothetical protein [Rossellomorea sp. GCM10028870]|uniref:hypothetical protein n=1 Tax=Rossellomorea sp. GCM10028870 TaxID=3273426 RepID=UPI0026098CB6|nr:hypothetical protein [uncultured Rossellomorea sp.]
MNEHLMEIVARDIVKGLPNKKRDIYQYVVGLEDELASRSETSEEFMALLVKHSPHQQAATHFKMSFGELMRRMREIEQEINAKLDQKLQNVTWIDYTDTIRSMKGTEAINSRYFFFSMNHAYTK